MMTFRIRLKRLKKAECVRLKFDLEKLNDPEVMESFQAKIGGKFAPLLVVDKDIQSLTEEFSLAVEEPAKRSFGKTSEGIKALGN